MSIHVCKCTRNGVDEHHLRYPGMSQEWAQRIADKINYGWLDGSDPPQKRIAALEAQLAAAQEPVTCQYAADTGMPEYRCAVKCQYDPDPRIAEYRELLRESLSALDSFDDAWSTSRAERIRTALKGGE